MTDGAYQILPSYNAMISHFGEQLLNLEKIDIIRLKFISGGDLLGTWPEVKGPCRYTQGRLKQAGHRVGGNPTRPAGT